MAWIEGVYLAGGAAVLGWFAYQLRAERGKPNDFDLQDRMAIAVGALIYAILWPLLVPVFLLSGRDWTED